MDFIEANQVRIAIDRANRSIGLIFFSGTDSLNDQDIISRVSIPLDLGEAFIKALEKSIQITP